MQDDHAPELYPLSPGTYTRRRLLRMGGGLAAPVKRGGTGIALDVTLKAPRRIFLGSTAARILAVVDVPVIVVPRD